MNYTLNHLSAPAKYPKPMFFPHFSLQRKGSPLPGLLLSLCERAQQVFLLINPIIPSFRLPTNLSATIQSLKIETVGVVGIVVLSPTSVHFSTYSHVLWMRFGLGSSLQLQGKLMIGLNTHWFNPRIPAIVIASGISHPTH